MSDAEFLNNVELQVGASQLREAYLAFMGAGWDHDDALVLVIAILASMMKGDE